ncbi:MAG TPA: serine/threonine-protein kinase [Labilithrix sp.]|nr:serine/threonine-protein kinase [Labilithrix sp.]
MSTKTLGKYRLIAELGQGGMADVYLAITSQGAAYFSKLVVIKRMKEHLVHDVEFMTMFVDEARIAARLNHPNLVQTLEVGESNGQHFLTMEYLDGQPLHRILNRARADFPTMTYLALLTDVLEGMHYAHELKDFDGTPLNIVHRDVTPHNIFVVYEGQVKVVDFGIAKAAGRMSETRHGVIKGKVAYMAPEQAMGQLVDRRVDVFAIGVMIFEAATRRRMWKGMKEEDIVRALIAGKIPAPKDVDPTVDDELNRICLRALEFSPDKRYPTAAALQEDLVAYLHTKGPRPSSRELGNFVAGLFADKRALTSSIIERQLALRAESQLSIPMLPQGTEASTSGEGSTALEIDPDPSTPFAASSPSPQSVPHDTPSLAAETMLREVNDKRRLLLGAAAALIVLLITSMITVIALRPSSGGPRKMLTVTLRATPLETRFSIDGGPSLDNPFIGEFPRDHKEHTIRAVAPGYPAKQEVIVFGDEDVSMRFSLASSARQNPPK